MSIHKLKTFGEMLRELREENGMPLRKLAARLDLDQSTLSKIERSERSPNPDLIEKIAKIFKVNKKELHVNFLSDKVANELMKEEYGMEALEAIGEKIKNLRKNTSST